MMGFWVSDGTENGTTMIKDINPGEKSSMPFHLTPYNGFLFFAANDGEHGSEWCITNGTTEGTYLVNDNTSGVTSGVFGYTAHIFNDNLFFLGYDESHGIELWNISIEKPQK